MRREEAVLADPGEVREANVRVVLMRGDAFHGQDQGVLFAEDGKLGFRGARSSFLLTPTAYERRVGHASERMGGLVLDVNDGSTLFLGARKLKGKSFAALATVLAVAEKERSPADDRVEWPSKGPIGKRKVISYRRRNHLILAALLAYYVLFFGTVGVMTWNVLGRIPDALIGMPLVLAPLAMIFLRMPDPTNRNAKSSLPRGYWLVSAGTILAYMGWTFRGISSDQLPKGLGPIWGIAAGMVGAFVGLFVVGAVLARKGKKIAAERLVQAEGKES